MAQKGLQVFLDQLVIELESLNSEALRSEYDLEPHTFQFEPTDLSDIMIKAAADQTQYGWIPSSDDIQYMKEQAIVYGGNLVKEVKDLGGSSWGKDGCVLVIAEDDKRVKVLPMGWQYAKANKQGKNVEDITVQSAFNKVKQVYSTQLQAYFENLQEHFGQELVEGSQKKKGFRQKSYKTDKKTGKRVDYRIDKKTGKKVDIHSRATSGASLFRVSAGHAHGDGILETSIARAMSTTADNLSGFLKNQKLDLSKIKKMLKDLEIDLDCVRDTDGEGFVIRMEYGPENGAFGQEMKVAKYEFIQGCKNASYSLMRQGMLATLPGSDSILTRNRKLIIKEVVDQFKKNKRATVIKHENIKLDLGKGNKATTTVGKAKLKSQKTISMKGVAVAVPKAGKGSKRKPKRSMGLKQILAVINSQITKELKQSMGEPALVNRTGRFAESVRAVAVTETAQGFPSVAYTYQKEPYQVFEASSGSRFSSAARDPRTLIDGSIREIVAQFGLGRLYTRRI